MPTNTKFQPFLKQAYDRSQLLNYILDAMPDQFNTFIDPFVNDGSILFGLHPEHAIVGDQNRELMNTYEMIRQYPNELLDFLNQYQRCDSKSFFNQMKHIDRKLRFDNWSLLQKAARYIYLNHTSKEMEWTTNWLGHCNLHYDRNENLNVDSQNLFQISSYLANHVSLLSGPYQSICDRAKPGDLVYLAPPYIPVGSAFVKAGQFNMTDQFQLSKVANRLMEAGVYVMVSNVDVPLLESLYPNNQFKIYHLYDVPATDEKSHAHEALVVSTNC